MKNYKRIHVWDLPTNKNYIKFKKDFREKIFDLARNEFGSFRLVGEFLGVKRGDTTIALNWKKGMNCCPLNLIIKLANKLGIPHSELEKNTEEIRYKTKMKGRGGSSGKPVFNPKLPIIVNENFAEIVGHLCGDGTISRSNPKKGFGFKYVNSEPKLIEDFKLLMNTSFGDVEPCTVVREGEGYTRPNYCLQYPSIISLFILSVFDCEPNDEKNIPDFIFRMSQEAKAKFLRAIFDDEGYVRSDKKKSIAIGLKPKNQIIKVKMLLEDIGIRTGQIGKENSRSFYRILIAQQDSLEIFQKVVGFKHPKKNNKLNEIMNKGWKFKRYDNYEAQKRIVDLLREDQLLATNQITKTLNRNRKTIQNHLGILYD